MKFAKIISCGNIQLEITADTCTLLDTIKKSELDLDKFNIDEFKRLYGDSPEALKVMREVSMPVIEIPFQTDFWMGFCHVLDRADHVSFWGSSCLKEACKSLVPNRYECWRSREKYEIINGGDEVRFIGEYSNCNISVENNDHIVIEARYCQNIKIFCGSEGEKSDRIWRSNNVTINYPYDYLELLENVESYIAKRAAPRKVLFQTELKSPKLSKGDQNVMDFLKANEKEIQQFKTYVNELKKREILKAKAEEIYRDLPIKNFLEVDGKCFIENCCGFDIYKKKLEIDACIKKLRDSYDVGEDKVEYEIRWISAESSVLLKAISKNCESEYRYGCILLKNPSFIDTPQEFDHILVSDRGIILIETKHWKGRVEICSDGKWLRDKDNNGRIEGIESPLSQIQRHETLMKSIFPDVPIYSLLVFTNPTVIISGVENCHICHVIYVDKLRETVMNILSASKTKIGAVNYYVNEIEKYKINIMRNDVRELGVGTGHSIDALRKSVEKSDQPTQTKHSVSESEKKDVKKLRRIAEGGNMEAQNTLGEKYMFGEDVQQNEEEAIKWFQKAGEQGYVEAIENLEILWDMHGNDGIGIKAMDALNRMVDELSKAAEQGEEEAAKKLFSLFAWRERDEISEKAANGLKRAAERGNAEAQILLF